MTDIDITPGQIWAWNASVDADESPFRIMTVDANRVRYQYLRGSDPHIEGGFIHTPATIREQCYLVTDVDATPAPLDPSKVTLMQVSATHLQPGDVIVNRLEGVPDGYAINRPQPAPEPEPMYEPGDLFTATVRGMPNKVVTLAEGADGTSTWAPWFTPNLVLGECWHRNEDVTDVRPLVVIDPAGMREKVAEVLRARMGGAVEAWFDYADAVLAELGIEATS